MRKKLETAGLALLCAVLLTACAGDRPESRMAEEWLGSGAYQADSRGRVGHERSKKADEVTRRAEDAVQDVRRGGMDAGTDMKRAAENAGKDLKRAAGK